MGTRYCFFIVVFLFFLSVAGFSFAEKEEEGDPSPPDAGQFVKMHPMIIPVVQNRQLMGTYVIGLVIETPSVHDGDEVRKIQPRVRDALLTDMYGIFSLVWDQNRRIHLSDFKTRLRHTAQKAAGKSRVKDVLIQSFQRQKSNRYQGYDYRK